MKRLKLNEAEWEQYNAVCEKYEKCIETIKDVKHLLKVCARGEEVLTIQQLKELMGVK